MNSKPDNSTPARPSWSWFSRNLGDEHDCLAAFIALETAEVLSGVKPSTLISIQDRPRACGRNLHSLWLKYGDTVMSGTTMTARQIGSGSGFIQLLFYLPETFAKHLERRDVSALLTKAGYQAPFTVDHTLRQLEAHLKTGSFPHEIGFILGYPVKDVAAFMGWSKLPFACQGPWKMFGNPRDSLRLAETFRSCRDTMARRLASLQESLDNAILSPQAPHPFFYQ